MKTESLKSTDLTRYEELLIAKKERLVQELASQSSRITVDGRAAGDDQPPLLHDQFVELHNQGVAYETLKLVESALDRLAEGEFGTCLACGQAISKQRLAAIPWAQYCIGCQERMSQEVIGTHRRAA